MEGVGDDLRASLSASPTRRGSERVGQLRDRRFATPAVQRYCSDPVATDCVTVALLARGLRQGLKLPPSAPEPANQKGLSTPAEYSDAPALASPGSPGADNAGLAAATASDPVAPLFVFDRACSTTPARPASGTCSTRSTASRGLPRRGSDLLVAGATPTVVPAVAAAHGAERVTWGIDYSGLARERDAAVRQALDDADVAREAVQTLYCTNRARLRRTTATPTASSPTSAGSGTTARRRPPTTPRRPTHWPTSTATRSRHSRPRLRGAVGTSRRRGPRRRAPCSSFLDETSTSTRSDGDFPADEAPRGSRPIESVSVHGRSVRSARC